MQSLDSPINRTTRGRCHKVSEEPTTEGGRQMASRGSFSTAVVGVTVVVALGACISESQESPLVGTEASPQSAPGSTEETSGSPTAVAQSITSEDVVSAFIDADVGVGKSFPMSRRDFGMAPLLTRDATRFLIPSMGPGEGGRAFVFGTVNDLVDTRDYFVNLGRSNAIFFSWTFTNRDELVLVQINGDLPRKEALRYKAVVDAL